MKKLNRQPDAYLFFELARLRTLWVNNEEIRNRVENRYKEVKNEFTNRKLRFNFNEHQIDTILRKREEEENKEFICVVTSVEKAKHKVGPLKGENIDNVYEYIISENDKVLGRTFSTQIEANVGDKLVVKRIENRLFGVIGKSVNQKEDNIVKETVDGHEGNWITVNGNHIFVRENEGIDEAFKRIEETKQSKQYLNVAKEKYGITDDYKKAGWILPEGEMLDFSTKDPISGSFKVGTNLYHRNHSDIGQVVGYGGNPVRDFQREGAIRFASYTNNGSVAASIDVSAEYTNKQWFKLKNAVFQNGSSWFAYDIYDGEKLVGSNGVENPMPYEVDKMEQKYKELKIRLGK